MRLFLLGALGGDLRCRHGAVRWAPARLIIDSLLFVLFGLAVALGAIIAYTAAMPLAGTGIRAEVASSRRAVSEYDRSDVRSIVGRAGDTRRYDMPSSILHRALPSPDGLVVIPNGDLRNLARPHARRRSRPRHPRRGGAVAEGIPADRLRRPEAANCAATEKR
jgi:hypothetical protein